jgi:hypothetical protein
VLEVSNFPIRALSKEERLVHRRVEFQRKMMVQEELWIQSNPQSSAQTSHGRTASLPDSVVGSEAGASSARFPLGKFGEFTATKDVSYIVDNANGMPKSDAHDEGDTKLGATGAASGTSASSAVLGGHAAAGGEGGKDSGDAGSAVKNPVSSINPALSSIRASIVASEKAASQSKQAEAAKEKALAPDRDRDADWNDESETRHLFHPTMCFTNHRKRMQIHLLSMKIDRLKRRFNSASRRSRRSWVWTPCCSRPASPQTSNQKAS